MRRSKKQPEFFRKINGLRLVIAAFPLQYEMMKHIFLAVLLSFFVTGVTQAQEGANMTTSNDTPTYKTAIFAGGCFWCMEKPFDHMDGVISTISGYTGGHVENPSYEQVSSGQTGHTEAMQVTYDPAVISYADLLPVFWRNIDPFDDGGQFCDRGSQYRSGIFYQTEDEKTLAELSKQKHEKILGKEIVTEITKASTFYPAEDYHQDYYERNPVRYKFYRWNCGRDQRLEEVWGE